MRAHKGLKVIIPSIKRPGTNFRDELPAISSASKRNAHEEEAGWIRARGDFREASLHRGASRLRVWWRRHVRLASLGRAAWRGGSRGGRRRRVEGSPRSARFLHDDDMLMYGRVVHKRVWKEVPEEGKHAGTKHEPKQAAPLPTPARRRALRRAPRHPFRGGWISFGSRRTDLGPRPSSRVIVALPSSSAYNAGDIRAAHWTVPPPRSSPPVELTPALPPPDVSSGCR